MPFSGKGLFVIASEIGSLFLSCIFLCDVKKSDIFAAFITIGVKLTSQMMWAVNI